MDIKDKKTEAFKALHCLYVAVDENIARNVNDKVKDYISALEEQLAQTIQKPPAKLASFPPFWLCRVCGKTLSDPWHIAAHCGQLFKNTEGRYGTQDCTGRYDEPVAEAAHGKKAEFIVFSTNAGGPIKKEDPTLVPNIEKKE